MPSSFAAPEKKHWWLSNSKMAERYVREAKTLIASQGQAHILAALSLLESALAVAPGTEAAMELKARCLLHLRRFKEVVDMFRDYVPSMKMAVSDDTSSGSSENSTAQLSKDRFKLLSSDGDSTVFRCFSVSDLKKKIMAGFCKNVENEGQWRYSILGQACCHLGLMEDALVLLQTGKRLAAVAYRRESVSLSDDAFSFNNYFPLLDDHLCENQPRTESENISQLLSQIKLLIRRKTAAMAALDAGLYSEAIRHFSKLVDGRRGAPLGFLSKCCVHRAVAFQSAGRLAEAIADCNRALALDKSCIEALSIRATLFESIKCLPDSLHDLEHLKLLYNSALRDRNLQRQNDEYREIPGKLCSLAAKIQQLKKRVAAGETGCVDYYSLIGLKKGCSKSEVESAYILLSLKLKPDKSYSFIEKCEFFDEKELDSVRDRAKLSALLLYRLIKKGYDNLMKAISDEEEAAERKRKKAAAMLQLAVHGHGQSTSSVSRKVSALPVKTPDAGQRKNGKKVITSPPCSVFKGVFCRDLSAVGNLLSQASFNRSIPVKYEALTC